MPQTAVKTPQEIVAWEQKRKLQGTWIFVAGRWPCQLIFADHNFVVRFQNGELYMGTFTVDLTHSPGLMEMTIEEGPEHYKGLTALCLYEIDGDQLHWCPNEPGSPHPYDAFPEDSEGKHPTLHFRRDGL